MWGQRAHRRRELRRKRGGGGAVPPPKLRSNENTHQYLRAHLAVTTMQQRSRMRVYYTNRAGRTLQMAECSQKRCESRVERPRRRREPPPACRRKTARAHARTPTTSRDNKPTPRKCSYFTRYASTRCHTQRDEVENAPTAHERSGGAAKATPQPQPTAENDNVRARVELNLTEGDARNPCDDCITR